MDAWRLADCVVVVAARAHEHRHDEESAVGAVALEDLRQPAPQSRVAGVVVSACTWLGQSCRGPRRHRRHHRRAGGAAVAGIVRHVHGVDAPTRRHPLASASSRRRPRTVPPAIARCPRARVVADRRDAVAAIPRAGPHPRRCHPSQPARVAHRRRRRARRTTRVARQLSRPVGRAGLRRARGDRPCLFEPRLVAGGFTDPAAVVPCTRPRLVVERAVDVDTVAARGRRRRFFADARAAHLALLRGLWRCRRQRPHPRQRPGRSTPGHRPPHLTDQHRPWPDRQPRRL